MDTRCEGGNFISSAFLADHLDMATLVEDESDEHHVQWVDFQGNTDFKPTGKVKLRWYDREIESGRKGRRGQETSSWFRVAPHLELESGVQPFQVLVGQEFLHENQLIQYTGLRLYKSQVEEVGQGGAGGRGGNTPPAATTAGPGAPSGLTQGLNQHYANHHSHPTYRKAAVTTCLSAVTQIQASRARRIQHLVWLFGS